MKEAVKAWAVEHIHKDKSGFELTKGIHYLKNCRAVKAYGSSTVYANSNSTVEANGNSTVYANDSSTVLMPEYSSNSRDNITLMANSTLKDCKTKTLYQAGEWKLVRV